MLEWNQEPNKLEMIHQYMLVLSICMESQIHIKNAIYIHYITIAIRSSGVKECKLWYVRTRGPVRVNTIGRG